MYAIEIWIKNSFLSLPDWDICPAVLAIVMKTFVIIATFKIMKAIGVYKILAIQLKSLHKWTLPKKKKCAFTQTILFGKSFYLDMKKLCEYIC